MAAALGWGIIGCGNVVENKSGPSILQAGRSHILAVMRRDAEKARPFAEANSVGLCTDDAEAVLAHPDVNIVYVATPPSSHKEYVLAAARAGKHVLVEKPMGLSAVEDREMIAACDQAGVELFVAYYRRFHPHVVKMKELIDAGRIGTPVLAQIDFAQPPIPGYNWGWRLQPEISGGGLFADVVTHRIDLMVHLLGEPETVCGLSAEFDPASCVEEAASLTVKFRSGAICSVSGDFASPRKADGFMIAGTRGVIHSERLDGHAFTLDGGGATETLTFDRDSAPHVGLIRHIERVLLDRQGNQCSGQAGMHTDAILDIALRHAR
jgi:predicted dehydrogenase